MNTVINALITEYRATRSQTDFAKLYDALAELRETNARVLLRSGLADENDALSVFNDVLLRTIDREYTGDFVHYLSASLKNARIDFIRKQKRLRNRTLSLDTVISDDGQTLGSRIPSAMDTVVDALITAVQRDQAGLIRYLLGSSADAMTLAIVERLPQYDSLNSLAVALGVHHSVITRKLRQLARKYDTERFGRISDYIAI